MTISAGLNHLIDCDAQPYVPDDLEIVEHMKGGQLEFDPLKILLHLEEGQKKTGKIVGNDLRTAFEGKPALNACVLDHLLANTNLIPDSWKKDEQDRIRYIYFWDTIYHDSEGGLYVRCLCWRDDRWSQDRRWLGSYFGDQSPTAILAN